MPAEHELMRQIAGQLDDDAPAISLDEIERRARTTTIDDATLRPSPRRRLPIVLTVAATALLIAGVGVVLNERSTAPTLRTSGTAVLEGATPPATIATSEPVPNSPSPTSTSDPTTAPVDPAMTIASPSSVRLDGDPATVIEAIDADRLEKLRTVPGFVATVRQSTATLDDGRVTIESTPGLDSRLTLLADGSMWAEFDSGGFASFDPTSGESRSVIVMPDGNEVYQLIEGWTENSTGMSILLGQDPARTLSEATQMSEVEIAETVHDGRPAWRIDAIMSLQTRPGSIAGEQAETPVAETDEQVETFVVDQATGLIVSSMLEWQGTPESRVRRTSELLDLELVDELPAAFPGEFPDGVRVDRSGDPSAFRPATLAEAAEWFGTGFVAPPEIAEDTTIFLTESEWDEGDLQTVRQKTVEIRAREGFATIWWATISKNEPSPGGPVPDGQLLVDGALCRDVDRDGGCDTFPSDAEPISTGALADAPLFQDGRYLSIELGGIRVGIQGYPSSELRNVAESFVAW
jgi:hypothetical protein